MKILPILLLASVAVAKTVKPKTSKQVDPPKSTKGVEHTSANIGKSTSKVVILPTSKHPPASSSVHSSASSVSHPTSSTSTGSGPQSTGATAAHVVYPKQGTDKSQVQAIRDVLKPYLKNPRDLFESSTQDVGVNYWTLPLTSDGVTALGKDKNIASVTPVECPGGCYDPTTAIIRQRDAADELVYNSQTPGTVIPGYMNQYFFDEIAGKDVTVYSLDNGAELGNVEFTKGANIAARARWIFANPGDNVKEDGRAKWHGTCMLGKISGHIYGVSKNVNPVIVKVKVGSNDFVWVDALKLIVEDVKAKKIKKAVLNMSLHWPKGTVPAGWDTAVFNNLKALEDLGIITITGSGNQGKPTLDGWPANFGAQPALGDSLKTIIVVGAVNPTTHTKWAGTNTDTLKALPHVYAPGEKVHCADGMPNAPEFAKVTSGTSLASANVAGLAAYLLSTRSDVGSPQALKDFILQKAYTRDRTKIGNSPNDLKGVWNGLDYKTIPPTCGSMPLKRADGSCVYQPGSTTTAAPTTMSTVKVAPTKA